ncbi:MAG: T9SS type A sorting domain-containing protein, partial [Bacteroidia bacterium]|nr:T9SS type A sorting domain-containing protein [Bacteroidia bacterium]
MKKYYLLSAALLCSAFSFAQPVLQASKFYTPGTVIHYQALDATSLTPGTAGASQTWNFANAVTTGETYTHTYMLPAGTPYDTAYTAATLVAEVTSNDPGFTTSYMYQSKNSSNAQYLGTGLQKNGTSLLYKYNDPQLIFNFPVNFGWTASDPFAASFSMSMGAFTYTVYRYGMQSAVADGYGTLVTPGGTYPNCLRVKYRQAYTDSGVVTGIPSPPDVTQNIKTLYSYIDLSGTVAVERFALTIDSIFDSSGLIVDKFAQFSGSNATGLNPLPQSKNISLHLYPNPASDQVELQLPDGKNGVFLAEIFDMTGKVVLRRQIQAG